jgi:hypothetical protein
MFRLPRVVNLFWLMWYRAIVDARLPHFHLLTMEQCKTCGGSGKKMAGSNAEYVRDGEPFSKGGQPNAGSLKSTNVTDEAG